MLLVYVDDILVTGEDPTQINAVISALNQRFALKILGPVNYFLGLEATRDDTGIKLTQRKYITDLLLKTNMSSCKPSPTPMVQHLHLSKDDGPLFDSPTLYRSTIGALQYLTLTRPDIAYPVNRLSQFLQQPTVSHWSACKRLLRYLQGTKSVGLHFKPASALTLQAFIDADWAGNVDDRRSTSGHCVLFGGNLINWSSHKQQVVARSSTEAEYRALASAATDILWLQSLFAEIGIIVAQMPILWCDNLGAGSLASNPVCHARTKHIEIDIHFVREKVINKQLEVRYCPTAEQVADMFTKALSISQFLYLCSKLNLCTT